MSEEEHRKELVLRLKKTLPDNQSELQFFSVIEYLSTKDLENLVRLREDES